MHLFASGNITQEKKNVCFLIVRLKMDTKRDTIWGKLLTIWYLSIWVFIAQEKCQQRKGRMGTELVDWLYDQRALRVSVEGWQSPTFGVRDREVLCCLERHIPSAAQLAGAWSPCQNLRCALVTLVYNIYCFIHFQDWNFLILAFLIHWSVLALQLPNGLDRFPLWLVCLIIRCTYGRIMSVVTNSVKTGYFGIYCN